MDAASRIGELRALLAARGLDAAHRDAGPVLPTGLPWLDAPGLCAAALHELVSVRPGTGAASVLRHLLAQAPRHARRLALVDAADAFDPGSCRGLDLSWLLWVRGGSAARALQAADLLLRDGNLPLVVVDLVLSSVKELRGIPGSAWFRLRGLAERGGSCALVMTPRPLVAGARVRVVLEEPWGAGDLGSEADARLRSLIPRRERRGADRCASAA